MIQHLLGVSLCLVPHRGSFGTDFCFRCVAFWIIRLCFHNTKKLSHLLEGRGWTKSKIFNSRRVLTPSVLKSSRLHRHVCTYMCVCVWWMKINRLKSTSSENDKREQSHKSEHQLFFCKKFFWTAQIIKYPGAFSEISKKVPSPRGDDFTHAFGVSITLSDHK